MGEGGVHILSILVGMQEKREGESGPIQKIPLQIFDKEEVEIAMQLIRGSGGRQHLEISRKYWGEKLVQQQYTFFCVSEATCS